MRKLLVLSLLLLAGMVSAAYATDYLAVQVVELDSLVSNGKDTVTVPLFMGQLYHQPIPVSTVSIHVMTTDINNGENVILAWDFASSTTRTEYVASDADTCTAGSNSDTAVTLSPLAPYMRIRFLQAGSPAATDSIAYKAKIFKKYTVAD